MLDRLSDFYRIVNLNPSDALITQRKEAVSAFLEQLSSRKLRHACVDIAVFGVGSAPSADQVSAAKLIVSAIQGPQPSFPSDIGANPLDLQVFAGVALGEYIRTDNDGSEVTAALLISALATRPLPQERYLADFLSGLLSIAQASSEAAAEANRDRPELEITAIQGGDAAALSKSVSNVLNKFKDLVARNLRADREELEILWWVFGGHSTLLGKPFQVLDVPQRILASASELSELVMVPAGKGSTQFLYATVKDDRPMTVRQLFDSCSSVLLEAVTRHKSDIADVLKEHPALLPLIWLSSRRLDSGMAGGWEAEFELKTHISAKHEYPASVWAVQAFNECVAARLLAASTEQDEDE